MTIVILYHLLYHAIPIPYYIITAVRVTVTVTVPVLCPRFRSSPSHHLTFSTPHHFSPYYLTFTLAHSMLLRLPLELQIAIADILPVPDLLHLRLTCAYLYDSLSPPTHRQLLDAEATDWARHHNVFTCRYCLRLRPAVQFADRMLQHRRSRAARDCHKRFCIDCGLMPREGGRTARYGPGAQLTINDQFFVLCLSCHQFLPGARDRHGRNTLECISCWQNRWLQAGATIGSLTKVDPTPIQPPTKDSSSTSEYLSIQKHPEKKEED